MADRIPIAVFSWPEDRLVTHVGVGGQVFTLPTALLVRAGAGIEIAVVPTPTGVDVLLADMNIPVRKGEVQE